ncbi:hypothetical protein E4U43_004506 [Claviceps pusilla]|uniref:Phosphatidylglycerol/phosphatidylinositol transfer protein n=1 Tax=Claviceps pusilla TaxID=123648 RepID=A0A9P7N5Q8_9HYPO|nr:hypothetical protein E4U43_004506 [Claviceps pusilla]
MRLSTAVLSALVAPSAALSFWNVDAQKGISSHEDLKIPGESPLEYCPNKKTDGYIEINRVDLLPNPPAAYVLFSLFSRRLQRKKTSRPHFSSSLTHNVLDSGKQLVIKANGTVKKAIEKGAYIDLTVKYGLIRLLTTTADLCEQMGEVDLKCPVEPGERVITKTVELPKEIPPGTYTVVADVFTAKKERITCLTATVTFSINGQGEFTVNEL